MGCRDEVMGVVVVVVGGGRPAVLGADKLLEIRGPEVGPSSGVVLLEVTVAFATGGSSYQKKITVCICRCDKSRVTLYLKTQGGND